MVSIGKISSISDGGKMATVTPYTGGIVTAGLVVPFHLVDVLTVGDPVIYAMFPDSSGIILHKDDGSGKSGMRISAKIENNILKIVASDTGIGSKESTESGSSMATSAMPNT